MRSIKAILIHELFSLILYILSYRRKGLYRITERLNKLSKRNSYQTYSKQIQIKTLQTNKVMSSKQ